MDPLEKLEAKVTALVTQYEQVEAQKVRLERECQELRAKISTLEGELGNLTAENAKLSKTVQSTNDAALKRISRLVDKIDQFQSELKIS